MHIRSVTYYERCISIMVTKFELKRFEMFNKMNWIKQKQGTIILVFEEW